MKNSFMYGILFQAKLGSANLYHVFKIKLLLTFFIKIRSYLKQTLNNLDKKNPVHIYPSS